MSRESGMTQASASLRGRSYVDDHGLSWACATIQDGGEPVFVLTATSGIYSQDPQVVREHRVPLGSVQEVWVSVPQEDTEATLVEV